MKRPCFGFECQAKYMGLSLSDTALRTCVRRGPSRDADHTYIDNKVAQGPPIPCATERNVFDQLKLTYRQRAQSHQPL